MTFVHPSPVTFSRQSIADATPSGSQTLPAVATLSNGGHVVVWADGEAVKSQRYDASGTKLGGEVTTYAGSSGSGEPAVAALAGGGYVVVWRGADGYQWGTQGQRYTADGVAVGGIFVVNTTTQYQQYQPSVAALANGGFVVTFTYASPAWPDVVPQEIKARVYGANGAAVGNEFQVNQYTTNIQSVSSVAGGTDGRFLATWTSNGQDGSGNGVYGRLYNANGTAVGAEFRINTLTAGNQGTSSAAGLTGGGYIVTWNSAAQDGSGVGIYAQRYDAAGVKIGSEFLVNTWTSGDQLSSSVTALADGGWLVGWSSNGQDGSGYGIYAQRYDAAGNTVGGEFRVAETASGSQDQVAVAGRTDGGWVTVWQSTDIGLNATNTDVYVRVWGHAAGAPQITAADRDIAWGAVTDAALLVEILDDAATGGTPAGERSITQYEFTDGGVGGGYFTLDGVQQADGTPFTIAAADVDRVKWVAAGADAADAVTIRVHDGEQWSAAATATLNSVSPVTALVVTTESNVDATPSGIQTVPSVAVLLNGGHVVTWTDGEDIKAQRYDAAGVKLGGEVTVYNGAIQAEEPVVAGLADGSYVIVWYAATDGYQWAVQAQRYTADGTAIGSSFTVNTVTQYQQYQPSVAALADGGFVVTFTYASPDWPDIVPQEIKARVYGANGQPLGNEFQINQYTANSQSDSKVAGGADGRFLVTWTSGSQDGSGNGIYGRLYDAQGAATGPEFLVNSYTASNQSAASVVGLAGGGYVVVWHSSGQDGSGWGVYGQRYDADGVRVGGEFLVNGNWTSSDQVRPSVAALADGGWLVGWTSNGQDGSGYGIYAQRYDAAGNTVGTEFRVAETTSGSQDQAAVAGRTDGGWVAVWQGPEVSGGTNTDVFVRAWGQQDILLSGFYEQEGTTGDDVLTGTPYRDRLIGMDGNDQLFGLGSDDSLIGGNGADTLDGGAGADTLTGGAGDDTYVVDDAGEVVTELSGDGTDLVLATVGSYTLSANVEHLSYVGSGDFAGTGNSAANSITGGDGNDTLNGGVGVDTLAGGQGDETYVVDNVGDVVVETAGQGMDTILTSLSGYTLTGEVENLTYTGVGNFTGTGSSYDNVITGGSGNDTLTGGGGEDTLVGGVGNDTYTVDSAGDLVVEAVGGGVDTVRTTANTYALAAGAEVENLVFIGSGNFTGTGSDTANSITGGTDADTLDGGTGADTLVGGGGDDRFVVDDVGDVVTEAVAGGTDTVATTLAAYTLGANVENLAYTGAGNFAGTGNGLANAVTGGSGNDMLDGGAGADTLTGGVGDDTYVVESASDVVVEAGGEGGDTVQTSLSSYNLGGNLENLTYTGPGSFSGTGNGLDNTLSAGDGSDTLDGGTGADTLVGGTGDDLYIVDALGDVVVEGAGGGTDEVRSTANVYTLSAAIENLTFIGSGDFTGTGNASANSITGGAGNDTLDGAAGTDTLAGGLGDDTYLVDDIGDVIDDAGGVDIVRTNLASYSLAADLEHLVHIGTGSFVGTGNGSDNSITGGAGNDTLDGAAGNDTLTGGAGNDLYIVDDAGDVMVEGVSQGTDRVQTSLSSLTLAANVENLSYTGSGNFAGTGNGSANSITGGVGNDTLDGQSGNDTLDGGAGADSMIGGLGNDSFIVDDVSDVVVEAAGQGTDIVRTSLSAYVLDAEVENLTYTGAASIAGTGNVLNNSITGGAGNDTLDGLDGNDTLVGGNGDDSLTGHIGNDSLNGGTGADTLTGGTGDDTYVVDNAGDLVMEAAGEGTDLVQSSVSHVLATGLENLTLTGGAVINGTGNDADNILTGNGAANSLEGGLGNDSLSGGAGADTLVGGAGDDSYTVDNAGDLVMEAAGEGTDLVQSSVSYTLSADVENLTLTGSAAINATGNDLANALTGNSGTNRLDGGIGPDTMAGGTGNDTYIVDDLGDVVTEAAGQGSDRVETSLTGYTLGANLEALAFTGSGNFAGTGNGLDNALAGGIGNDTLDGGTGADTLAGGAGDDTYIVDNAGDLVVEASGEGTDLVQASVNSNLSANVENLTYTGSGDFAGTGNGLDNVLTGGVGNDTLDGGTGADTLAGGAGDDTYIIDNAGDVVTEAASQGTDTIQAAISHTLSANVENLILTGTGSIDATGNDLANQLTGNSGVNRLDGGLGGDSLAGGDGNDTYIVDDAGDVVTEAAGEGTDTVSTVLAAYTLGANVENLAYTSGGDFAGTGNAGENAIIGGAGNDTLDGGAGADTLTGGAGNDRFVLDDGDMVADFAAGDLLDLSGLDADAGLAGDQGFTWIDAGAFTNVAGELRWEGSGSDVKLLADRDGDGTADLEVTLTGVTTVTGADLVL